MLPVDTLDPVPAGGSGWGEDDVLSPPPALRRGLAGSLLLHALVAALVLVGRPTAAPPLPPVVPVDLVVLAARSESPRSAPAAPVPQAAAPAFAATPRVAPPAASPAPPLPPVKPPAPTRSRIERPAAPATLAPSAPAVAAPEVAPDQGVSSTDAGSGAPGPGAALSVKDFIRAQIERHWNVDLAALDGRDFTVAIHIEIGPDGRVLDADIVNDPRFMTDPVFRNFALSARDAAMTASPLQVPPELYEQFKDLTLQFDPREVVR